MNPYPTSTLLHEAWAFGYGDAVDPGTLSRPFRFTSFHPTDYRVAWRRGARMGFTHRRVRGRIAGLPMPNDKLADGRIVIASCYGRDEDDEHDWNTLLLLNPTPGNFYSVVQVGAIDARILNEQVFPNIVPAAREYEEQSGAWGE